MNDDQRTLLDEIKRHVDVTAEGLRREIQLVAEGVLTVDRRLDRFQGEVRAELHDFRGEMDQFRVGMDQFRVEMDQFRAEVNQRFDALGQS